MGGHWIALLPALLLQAALCASGEALFRRPAENELVVFKPIRDRCEYKKYGGRLWEGTADCLQWLAEHEPEYTATPDSVGLQPVDTSKPLIVHAVWSGHLYNNKLQLMVQSFLASQVRKPPAQQAQLWLWMHTAPGLGPPQTLADLDVPDTHIPSAPELMHCPSAIKFKRWHSGMVLAHMPKAVWAKPVAEYLDRYNVTVQAEVLEKLFMWKPGRYAVSFSDFQRFALLAAFGGFYIDADVQLLRDLRPLQIQPFWYRWEIYYHCNTAIVYSRKDDPIMLELVKLLLKPTVTVRDKLVLLKWPSAHPRDVYALGGQLKQQFLMMPVPIFNAMWGIHRDETSKHLPSIRTFHDVDDPQATPEAAKAIFGGAFANHFHNHWTHNFSKHSWGAAFDTAYQLYFSQQDTNIYGEYFDWNLCHLGSS